MATLSTWIADAAAVAALSVYLAAAGEEGKTARRLDHGQEVPVGDHVPPAVRATVARESQGRDAGKIVAALQNGNTVYFVQYAAEGGQHALLVAADGRVINRWSEDDGDD